MNEYMSTNTVNSQIEENMDMIGARFNRIHQLMENIKNAQSTEVSESNINFIKNILTDTSKEIEETQCLLSYIDSNNNEIDCNNYTEKLLSIMSKEAEIKESYKKILEINSLRKESHTNIKNLCKIEDIYTYGAPSTNRSNILH